MNVDLNKYSKFVEGVTSDESNKFGAMVGKMQELETQSDVNVALLLTGESGNKLINFQDYNAHTIGIVLLWLSAFLTLYTGYDYVKKGIDHAID